MSKLNLIATTVANLLYEQFEIAPSFTFEKTFDWLQTNPSKNLPSVEWSRIKDGYKSVTDGLFDLELLEQDRRYAAESQNQSVDIWFAPPYNFILEFDEKQHFNQYRLATLENYTSDWMIGDLNHYIEKCKAHNAVPGSSGFQKIKPNLLFPFFQGESPKQDNRIRQRAFRDFLKDFIPLQNGLNPTLRIPFTATNNKIKDFNSKDLDSLVNYLKRCNFPGRIKLQ
jgi:hypothetical protein